MPFSHQSPVPVEASGWRDADFALRLGVLVFVRADVSFFVLGDDVFDFTILAFLMTILRVETLAEMTRTLRS
jgi:hypothetical protein